eukprot:7978803-Pyramimonas_sp.AAC.1
MQPRLRPRAPAPERPHARLVRLRPTPAAWPPQERPHRLNEDRLHVELAPPLGQPRVLEALLGGGADVVVQLVEGDRPQ